MTRLLSHSHAARFYDLLGARLDTQAFYEAEALRDLPDVAIGATMELGRSWRTAPASHGVIAKVRHRTISGLGLGAFLLFIR